MDTIKECELNHAIAGGFMVAAAVVVIGLIASAVDGSDGHLSTVHDRAAVEAMAPSTEYFPSGYTVNVVEPAPHVEAF